MSTTVMYVPSEFNERAVNKILGMKRFERGELHTDEIADLWGFVKHFYSGEQRWESLKIPIDEFIELCDKVDKEEIRYEIGGIGPKSPNRLAIDISKSRSSKQISVEMEKTNDINLQRIKKQKPPVVPDFEIRESKNEISLIFDGNVQISDSGEITGEDYLDREYCINVTDIHKDLSAENHNFERYCKNNVTTIVFYL